LACPGRKRAGAGPSWLQVFVEKGERVRHGLPRGRLVEFSAQAVGEFAPGDRCKVKDLKPGKFAGAK